MGGVITPMEHRHFSMAQPKEPPALKYGQLPPEPEQLEFVREASERIQGYGFLMKRQFDEGKVEEGLKYATEMLQDMKTNQLSPVHYNELYQLVLSELSVLALTFQDVQFFTARRVAELYETLQYTAAIVPRLYLLFTVAPAFIKAGHARARDVMRDLIELARGVQHPTRALFLRHFLLHIMKDILPDGQNTSGGSLEDTLTFILENFKQMNVL
jgi:vacuolar protein sorting-associated protein 35